jgi:transposase-like protein
VALYARGLTLREIQAFLADMYGVDVSPDLISTVTDAVVTEVTGRQGRPLEPMVPRRPLTRRAISSPPGCAAARGGDWP